MKKNLAIIGGGITGLTLAHLLKKKFNDDVSITLFEKDSRLGGCIQTIKKNDFLFELGPRGFLPKGEGLTTLNLIKDLNLKEMASPASDDAKIRYLWHQGTLHPLPTSLSSFLLSPLTRSLLLPCLREFFSSPQTVEDESIAHFFKRRFNTYILETLIDPLVTGIYAGDVDKLSIKSCFPKLYKWERHHHSVIRGFLFSRPPTVTKDPFIINMKSKPLISFRDGMETLVHALEKRLLDANVDIQWSHTVNALSFANNQVHLAVNGKSISYDHVFSAVPATAVSKILPSEHMETKKILNSIPFASMAIVNFGFKSNILKKKGFGYLIPSKENEEILGTTWDSYTFPQQNNTPEETRITTMIGGARMKDFGEKTISDFIDMAIKALNRHLNLSLSPDIIDVNIAKESIPQYTIGHHTRCQAINMYTKKHSNLLSVTGSSFSGIGINSCIAAAEGLAKQFSLS